MNPVTLIVAALAAGAGSAVQDGASAAVKDAYARVAALAKRRFAGRPKGELVLAEHHAAPQTWRAPLATELAAAGADGDAELIAAAQALMSLVDEAGSRAGKYAVTVRDSQGVQVGDHNMQANTFGPRPDLGSPAEVSGDGSGAGRSPVTRVEIPGGQGVQAGDHNTQRNEYKIETYIHHLAQLLPAPAPRRVVTGDMPQPPPAFQPRAGLVAALRAAGSGVSVVRAVTGMRGVGKTHLAATYARSCIRSGWRLVAWVSAEDLGGLLAGLGAVADALGLGAGKDAAAAGQAVRHWLETDGDRCLLVFDNATDPASLQPFLPAAGRARVIITSNEQSMAILGAGVPVGVFSEAEALAFLAERTGSADTDGAAAVAAELGYLPLGLAQAAAVIAGQRLDYGTYLGRLRTMPVAELLSPVRGGQYPRGVAAAVLLSLEGARAGDETGICGAVMELAAVLSPAGVRRALVQGAAWQGIFKTGRQGALDGDRSGGELPAEVVDRALGQLAGVSLLTFSVDGSIVSAHRLVIRVIQDQLAAGNSLTTVCAGAAQLLETLAGSLSQTWHHDRAAARDLVEQIIALSRSSADCPADDALARRMIGLRGRAVWFLNMLDDSAVQTILIAEPLLADLERVLGPTDHESLKTRGNLANAYRAAGRTGEAITMYEQTLAGMERVLGQAHPHTLQSRNNLANVYLEAGRTGEAITLHEQTLADMDRVVGPAHPDILQSRNNLANAYLIAGRTGEAITMYGQTLADRERVLGPDHPGTLTTRHNLAAAYRTAGRTAEAMNLHEQTLADRERVLGPDHPDTLKTRHNLAAAYRAAGRTSEADKIQPSDP